MKRSAVVAVVRVRGEIFLELRSISNARKSNGIANVKSSNSDDPSSGEGNAKLPSDCTRGAHNIEKRKRQTLGETTSK